MSQFYTALAAAADRLLRTKGQAVTINRAGDRVYNTATGTASGGDTAENGIGVILNLSDLTEASVAAQAGGLAQVGKVKMILGASGITKAPGPGDTITALDEAGQSVVWSVVSCDAIAPAGVPVLYNCYLER